jgi:hypothetical protein
MKALASAQPPNGAGIRAAGADCRNGRERSPNQVQIDCRIEGQQSRFIQLDGGLEEALDVA